MHWRTRRMSIDVTRLMRTDVFRSNTCAANPIACTQSSAWRMCVCVCARARAYACLRVCVCNVHVGARTANLFEVFVGLAARPTRMAQLVPPAPLPCARAGSTRQQSAYNELRQCALPCCASRRAYFTH